MLKKIISFITIFIFTFSTLISAAMIKDVPTEHWAYQSVKKLVDKGLLELYDDGTFRGNGSVSRYQMAEMLARVLEKIETGSVSASEQDMELLRKLSVEFQEELVDLAIQGDAFSEQIKSLEQKNMIQDEFMVEIKDVEISSLKDDIKALKQRISNAESDVTNIIDSILKIKQIEERLAAIEKTHKEQTALIEKNQKEIAELNENKETTAEQTIQSLNDKISINATRLNSLQDELSTVKSELKNKDLKIEELEVENTNYKNYLYGVAGVSLILLLLSN